MQLYHSTSKSNAAGIYINGFNTNECSDYGDAVYFSDDPEWAKEYEGRDGVTIVTSFNGFLCDLQNPAHWRLFKDLLAPCFVTDHGFDGIKDGNIIAIYNPKTAIPIRSI